MDSPDSSNSDHVEEKFILVPYGTSPPIGYWHKDNGEADKPIKIDYVPRGKSWYFSIVLEAQSGDEGNVKKLLKSMGRVHLAPIDHRIILGTNSCDLQYLDGAVDFIKNLQKNGGCYWIKDFDLNWNSVSYTLSPPIDADFESNRLRFPAVKWPETWHATLPSQPYRPGAPSIKAPWRRLVVLEGLSMMAREFNIRNPCGLHYFKIKPDAKKEQAQTPLLFDSTTDWLINQHLRGDFGFADFTLANGYAFHVSWFEVCISSDKLPFLKSASGSLKSGKLYGTENDKPPKYLCHEAYTIYAVPEDSRSIHATSDYPSLEEMATTQDHWTILILASLPLSVTFDEQRAYDDTIGKMQITMVRLITIGLLRAWHGFQSLLQHIDSLLYDGSEIFNPILLDDLLIEDGLFSKARRFSWLVNTLEEADRILEEDINAWDSYYRRFILNTLNDPLVWTDEQMKELQGKISRCNEMSGKLQQTRSSFEKRKKRASALRDGMFSVTNLMEAKESVRQASESVREARASTRLGENVQLLTYVSIFYLPLAFCASLWSTTDTFGYTTMAYTMVLVAVTTYIIVFNLRSIVDILSSRANPYVHWKKQQIREMKEDKAWQAIGEKFEHSRSVQRDKKPSEWLAIAFYVQKLLRKVGLIRVNGEKQHSPA